MTSKAPDKFSLHEKDFKAKIKIAKDKELAKTQVQAVVSFYNNMSQRMPDKFKEKVVNFLREDNWAGKQDLLSQHTHYRTLRGNLQNKPKQLHFGMWIVVAACWPDHKLVQELAKDMSEYWGHPFPGSRPFYPAKVKEQKALELFDGVPLDQDSSSPDSDHDSEDSKDKGNKIKPNKNKKKKKNKKDKKTEKTGKNKDKSKFDTDSGSDTDNKSDSDNEPDHDSRKRKREIDDNFDTTFNETKKSKTVFSLLSDEDTDASPKENKTQPTIKSLQDSLAKMKEANNYQYSQLVEKDRELEEKNRELEEKEKILKKKELFIATLDEEITEIKERALSKVGKLQKEIEDKDMEIKGMKVRLNKVLSKLDTSVGREQVLQERVQGFEKVLSDPENVDAKHLKLSVLMLEDVLRTGADQFRKEQNIVQSRYEKLVDKVQQVGQGAVKEALKLLEEKSKNKDKGEDKDKDKGENVGENGSENGGENGGQNGGENGGEE